MTTTPVLVDSQPAEQAAGDVLRVVVVNGSPSQPSKTMGLVGVVLDTLTGMLPVDASQIDVYRDRKSVV